MRGDTAPRRLIIPGAPKPGLQIMVPKGYEDREEKPAYRCEICSLTFFAHEGQAWERHVGECARRHRDEIAAEVEKRRSSPLHEEFWDPELAEHMRTVGHRMRRENRLVVLPNERAGF